MKKTKLIIIVFFAVVLSMININAKKTVAEDVNYANENYWNLMDLYDSNTQFSDTVFSGYYSTVENYSVLTDFEKLDWYKENDCNAAWWKDGIPGAIWFRGYTGKIECYPHTSNLTYAVKWTAPYDGTFTFNSSIEWAAKYSIENPYGGCNVDNFMGVTATLTPIKNGNIDRIVNKVCDFNAFAGDDASQDNIQYLTNTVSMQKGDFLYFTISAGENTNSNNYYISFDVNSNKLKDMWNISEEANRYRGFLNNDFEVYSTIGKDTSVLEMTKGNYYYENENGGYYSYINTGCMNYKNTAIDSKLTAHVHTPNMKSAIRWIAPYASKFDLCFPIYWDNSSSAQEYDGIYVEIVKVSNNVETSILSKDLIYNDLFDDLSNSAKTVNLTTRVDLEKDDNVYFTICSKDNCWYDSYQTNVIINRTVITPDNMDVIINSENNKTIVQERKNLQLSTIVKSDGYELIEGTDYTLSYESENSAIATINETGVIKGQLIGATRILVKVSYNNEIVATEYFNINVIKGATINISGSTILADLGINKKLSANVKNTTDTNIIWTSLTPDIVSIDSEGNITGNSYGYGVVSAYCDGATAYHSIKVYKEYENKGTIWNLTDYLPTEQGSSGFKVLYNSQGNIENDLTSNILGLNSDACYKIDDEIKWKGGSTFATIDGTTIMPGDGTMAVAFNVPANGSYRINFEFEWNEEHRKNASEIFGFDGAVLGISVLSVDGKSARIEYSKIADKMLLVDNITKILMKELYIDLLENETLIFFIGCRENGGWDQFDYSYSIANNNYIIEVPIDNKPIIASNNYAFDKTNPEDIIINVDLKGKSLISLKIDNEVIFVDNYNVTESTITIKQSLLSSINNGLKHFTITTEEGSVVFKLYVSGETSIEEKGCKSNNNYYVIVLVLVFCSILISKTKKIKD